MAKVKITGHASGTGVFTITAPNSNTDRTITLPDASVTLGTDATKLPLAGGALTGALTTNSTIDGRDVAADGVLATNALPKAGGTLTGNVVIGAISDNAERSLTINSSADSYLRLKTQNDNEVGAIMFGNATGALDGRIQYDSRRMRFFTGNAERLNLTADGRGLSQFTAKAWFNLDQTGTQNLRDSHNVSSVSDNGTGRTTFSFTNNLGSINYSVTLSTNGSSGSAYGGSWDNDKQSCMFNLAVGSFATANAPSGSYADYDLLCGMVFGD